MPQPRVPMPARTFHAVTNTPLPACASDANYQGDQGAEHDTFIAVPTLMLSSAVLFNWQGAPQKDEMLNRLGWLAKTTTQLKISKSSEQDAGTGGKAPFGHLYIVCRDWMFGDESVVRELVLEEELAEERAQAGPE